MENLALANDDDVEIYGCSICHGVLRDAMVVECGHSFCQECPAHWLRRCGNEPTCPECRAQCGNGNPNVVVRRMIERAQVLYPNSVRGCQWNGGRDQVESHLTNDCEYSDPIPCSNNELGCSFVGSRVELAAHEQECLFGKLRPMADIMMRRMNFVAEALVPNEPQCGDIGDNGEEGTVDWLREQVNNLAEQVAILQDEIRVLRNQGGVDYDVSSSGNIPISHGQRQRLSHAFPALSIVQEQRAYRERADRERRHVIKRRQALRDREARERGVIEREGFC